jgi:hypothetical protein
MEELLMWFSVQVKPDKKRREEWFLVKTDVGMVTIGRYGGYPPIFSGISNLHIIKYWAYKPIGPEGE